MAAYDREALLELLGADGGKGAKTKLTDPEWMRVAARRHGQYVLVIDGHVRAEGKWLRILGQFLLSPHAGDRVKFLSHTDYVTRLVSAGLGPSGVVMEHFLIRTSGGPMPGGRVLDAESWSWPSPEVLPLPQDFAEQGEYRKVSNSQLPPTPGTHVIRGAQYEWVPAEGAQS